MPMISKIQSAVRKITIPSNGATSADDMRDFIDAMWSTINQIQTIWNTELQPLINTLPSGGVTVAEKDSTINPFVNGVDGSQIYVDNHATAITDEGRYYDATDERPRTIKESLSNTLDSLTAQITQLQNTLTTIEATTLGITEEVKQNIGYNLFDATQSSSTTSLDGREQRDYLLLKQVVADVFNTGTTTGAQPDSTYITNPGGLQTLVTSIYDLIVAGGHVHRVAQLPNRSPDTRTWVILRNILEEISSEAAGSDAIWTEGEIVTFQLDYVPVKGEDNGATTFGTTASPLVFSRSDIFQTKVNVYPTANGEWAVCYEDNDIPGYAAGTVIVKCGASTVTNNMPTDYASEIAEDMNYVQYITDVPVSVQRDSLKVYLVEGDGQEYRLLSRYEDYAPFRVYDDTREEYISGFYLYSQAVGPTPASTVTLMVDYIEG